MVMTLKGKRIAITGGTSGIGLALVRRLQADNEMIVISRPSKRLEKLRATSPDIEIVEAELADHAQVTASAKAIEKRHNRLDVLINNAAVQNTPAFIDRNFDRNTIAEEIAVNLAAPILLSSLLLPLLQRAPQAAIVNINSGLAIVPKRSSATYCATKGGLNIFSQSLRHQLEGTNVAVLQTFLPLVETRMTAGRGSGKISSEQAADRIVVGIERGKPHIDIGKVKLLRWLHRLSPTLAQNAMKSA